MHAKSSKARCLDSKAKHNEISNRMRGLLRPPAVSHHRAPDGHRRPAAAFCRADLGPLRLSAHKDNTGQRSEFRFALRCGQGAGKAPAEQARLYAHRRPSGPTVTAADCRADLGPLRLSAHGDSTGQRSELRAALRCGQGTGKAPAEQARLYAHRRPAGATAAAADRRADLGPLRLSAHKDSTGSGASSARRCAAVRARGRPQPSKLGSTSTGDLQAQRPRPPTVERTWVR